MAQVTDEQLFAVLDGEMNCNRNYREAYGGQHAVALDGFSNQ